MVLILLKDMGAENRTARGNMPVIAHTHVHRDKRGSRMIARLAVMRLSEMTPEDQSG